jgi:hypothetical protein
MKTEEAAELLAKSSGFRALATGLAHEMNREGWTKLPKVEEGYAILESGDMFCLIVKTGTKHLVHGRLRAALEDLET